MITKLVFLFLCASFRLGKLHQSWEKGWSMEVYNINSYPMCPTKMTAHPQKGNQTYPHDIVPFPGDRNTFCRWFFSPMAAAEVKKAIVKNMENSSITFEEAEKKDMAVVSVGEMSHLSVNDC